MRRISSILSIATLLFVGALTFGCTSLEIPGQAGNDETQAGNNETQVGNDGTPAGNDEIHSGAVTMTTTISLDAGSDTKALTAAGVKTFAPGDRITVFYEGDYIRRAVSEALSAGDISSDGKKAVFTVTLINPMANETLRYIYPADMAISTYDNEYLAIDDANTIDFGRFTSQDGALASLASNLDLAVYDGTFTASKELPLSVTLQNRLCIGEFNIKNEGGTKINDKLVRLTISDGTNSYSVNRPASDDPFYIAMLPVENKTVSISATDGQNYYSKQVNSISLAGNTIYPINVTVAATDDRSTPLTFEAVADGAVTFSVGDPPVTIEYRIGEGSWTNYSGPVSLSAGQTVSFRGNNASYSGCSFSCSADCYLYGNIMSLVKATDYASATSLTANNTFSGLFYGNTHICSHASKPLLLPATGLTEYCYYDMFRGCSGLTIAPALPASALAMGCYCGMFFGCAGLTTAPALPATTLAVDCYSNMFRNCESLSSAPALPAVVLKDLCYSGMFQGCTSLSVAPAMPATTLALNCYSSMFNGCYSLGVAPSLPATALTEGCYQDMLANCVNLYAPPELPATTLAEHCYDRMFQGCTSLSIAPALPATTLAVGCYESMFGTCIGLVTAPALPATTLAEGCYAGMFRECSSLTTAPSLPATTMVENCYGSMFSGCKSLSTAPALPAETLAKGCYESMFGGCKDLAAAPSLPASTMAECCYKNMFLGCTSLSAAPALPAETLAKGCYESMFGGCKDLAAAPSLPANALAERCYAGMFKECIKLTTAPYLPAFTLVTDCYDEMFCDCTKLNSVDCLAMEYISGNTDDWLFGVYQTGTFTTYVSAVWSTGPSGIPSGWNVNGIPIITSP